MNSLPVAFPKRPDYPCMFCGAKTRIAEERFDHNAKLVKRTRTCTSCGRDMYTKDDGK